MKFLAITLLLTFYCPCKICTGRYSKELGGKGYVTWKQIPPNPEITIACPSSWKSRLFIIPGFGLRECEDTGKKIKRNKVDVFVPNHSEALRLGKKTVHALEVIQ